MISVIKNKEINFEQDIEASLVQYGGWESVRFQDTHYDANIALDPTVLLEFVKQTQPKNWKRYVSIYRTNAEQKFLKRLNEEITNHGILHVLRKGIRDRGVSFKVVYFQPASSLNTENIKNYEANRFQCVRQFQYSNKYRNTIDMVLMINGIPLVALELKNQYTGQNVEHARLQFEQDRDPKELIFQFNSRFLVYFAVDHFNVLMTTKLAKGNTYFLPFDQGSNGPGRVGGAGNPSNPSGYPTSYLWENVLTSYQLLDIFERFMNLEEKKKLLIFPRYHQLDVVKKLISDTQHHGPGKNYLIQHSAGSGKSNSIAWLAYHLASLHSNEDQPIYSSVIVVTDRTVLDRQLQNTLMSFEHTVGQVETIGDNKTSQDLKTAINDQKKIIITTLQKFPVIYDEIDNTAGRSFAILVDEAHSSQTGSSTQKLKHALADKEASLKEYQEFEESVEDQSLDDQDQIVQTLLSQGQHDNLSFFAFTATPKEKTIEEDPELPKTEAVRAIAKYQSLHPWVLRQKAEIMIEQFRSVTQKAVQGRGKAMIVTASRLHAVRYMQEFKKYIKEKGYTDMDVLVAFSGTVEDDGIEYTEPKMNLTHSGERIQENQLKEAFHSEDFNLLIVAEKYQTGFDEPLLHTMFVDKRLRGVKAVQTLSRLNRTMPGKTDTFILDFVNTAEEIYEAFQPFYEATSLKEEININLIYDTQSKLRKFHIYNDDDIQTVMKLNRQAKQKQNDQLLGRLSSVLRPVISRYSDLPEDVQYDFRVTLRNFNKWYNYIAQIDRTFDKELLEESIFTGFLLKFIPEKQRNYIDIEDKVKLEYYKLQEDFKGDIALVNEDVENGQLAHPSEVNATVRPEEEYDSLNEIIHKINERFPNDFTQGDRVLVKNMRETLINNTDAKLVNMAQNNSEEMFANSLFQQQFQDFLIDQYNQGEAAYSKMFSNNRDFYDTVYQLLAKDYYRWLRSQKADNFA